MQTQSTNPGNRYAKVIEVSKRVRWDIERDVIRGRGFDFSKHVPADGLSLVNELDFLGAGRPTAATARCRAAPTPTSSASSSASSSPR